MHGVPGELGSEKNQSWLTFFSANFSAMNFCNRLHAKNCFLRVIFELDVGNYK